MTSAACPTSLTTATTYTATAVISACATTADAGSYSAQRVISVDAEGARSVYAADVDGDGDVDALSASYTDDTVAWYENDGSQSFTRRI